ncbi:MAG: hypothetical protein NTZ42_03235 [Candidatus Gribaldobacteria bacterium]|nr:hypothetical protein [Candidatus Gribaldobacteria bacterium]
MLPKQFEKYFWDTDFKKVDKEKNKDYIVVKFLEYGDITALKWLFANFSQKYIKQIFSQRRGFSLRVANFWRLFFNLPENKVVCLNKFYQKQQKVLWPY